MIHSGRVELQAQETTGLTLTGSGRRPARSSEDERGRKNKIKMPCFCGYDREPPGGAAAYQGGDSAAGGEQRGRGRG